MKIAVIDTTINGELIGGAQTFLPELLKGLIAKGNEVHLIAKAVPNEKIRKQIEESNVILHTDLWNPNGLIEETTLILSNWINQLNPDIYLISVSPDIGWTVLPLLNPEIATLTIGHTDSNIFYSPADHYRNFLTRTVGVSSEICDYYAINCKIAREKIEWIPYGVQQSENEPIDTGENTLKIIYVGRLEEKQKRLSDLIKIVQTLSEKQINYNLSIVGDGEEMPKIKDKLSNEINNGTVVLHGWLKSADVIQAMRESDVFILTSAYEGFCIALVESMANGCCPVVTNIRSGNKQLIKDEENGFILPIGSIYGFAEKLSSLSLNRSELLELRKKAWKTGKDYSIKKMVEAYQQSFLQAIGDAKKICRQTDSAFPLMKSCRSRYPLWLRKLKAKINFH